MRERGMDGRRKEIGGRRESEGNRCKESERRE